MKWSNVARFKAFIVACALLLPTLARAEDWPAYLHDQARGGHTQESLKTPLAAQWVYTPAYAPRPAWPEPPGQTIEPQGKLNRVAYDSAFQPVVAGGVVFFASSADYKVYALDLATGRERWSFCAGGPIRLAPTVSNGRVFVGSDDGCAYCLDATDGRLIWKLRPMPRDERILGNGHMISRWPIRTGIVVDDGTAYFGGGVFPHDGLYLCAARAEDGKLIWMNDTIGSTNAGQVDFSPQGYLLASKTMLFVPSGRGMPAAFSRATGEWLYQNKLGYRDVEAGGIVGGTYALLDDEQIYTGTNLVVAMEQKTGAPGFAWFPGRRLVVDGDMAYMATGTEVAAVNRQAYAEASRNFPKDHVASQNINKETSSNPKTKAKAQAKAAKAKAKAVKAKPEGKAVPEAALDLDARKKLLAQNKKTHQEQADQATLWRVPCACDAALILSGNLVIVGGDGQVVALDSKTGFSTWNAKIEGRAAALAVANGHLLVSSDSGKIYCFAPATDQPAEPLQIAPAQLAKPYPDDELSPACASAAEAIAKQSGLSKGFCLILGNGTGRLAYELARRTDLKIYGIDPDAKKVEAARKALSDAGLYGARVTVEQGDPASPPYSNYFANLVVSETALADGNLPGDAASLARLVKPCGGMICMGLPTNAPATAKQRLSPDSLRQWMAAANLGDCAVSQDDGLWATVRRGPLPGAGKWTHEYAEPGNTACSDDQLVRGPLRLLWYGEPGPARMVDRHAKAAAPLALDGRMFVQGKGVVMAYDSYNGLLLWQRDIPEAVRSGQNAKAGNLALDADSLFVATGDKCLRLDAATGQTRATYEMPVSPKGQYHRWGYTACVDGRLYGSAVPASEKAAPDQIGGESDAVFAIDVESGKPLWTYRGQNVIDLTIAIGEGRVFLVDSSISEAQRQELLKQDKTSLKQLPPDQAKQAEAQLKKIDARMALALDAATGKKDWAKPVDVTNCSHVGTSGGELAAAYQDGVLALYGASANGHMWAQFLAGEFSRRRIVALSAKDGAVLWAKDANYRHRPLIVGKEIVAEPWAYDLRTGAQKTRQQPITGAEQPWQFLRPGHHCGAVSASPAMLFFRSGFTGYYDLAQESGAMHFSAHRLGCWINAIPANGLLLAPEAASGCVCLFSVVSTVVLEPCQEQKGWGIYSAAGPNTPVKTLAVAFGAPGDRKDDKGKLWLAYPRPKIRAVNAAMELAFDVQTKFNSDGGAYCRNAESLGIAGTATPWIYASGLRGVQQCIVPLQDKGQPPVRYTVRLHFAELDDTPPGQRVFDVQLQGQTVAKDLDIAKEAGGPRKPLVKEFKNVETADNLVIGFGTSKQPTGPDAAPILSAIEVVREEPTQTQLAAADTTNQ